MSEPHENGGGFGESLFNYDKPSKSDIRLMNRAVANDWPVPQPVKQKIIDRMELVIDASDDDDLVIRAAGLVINADKVNAARERNQVESDKPSTGSTSIVQINYNALSLEELIKLEELCVKAGLPDDSGGNEEA